MMDSDTDAPRVLELAQRTIQLVQSLCHELEAQELPVPGFEAEKYVSLNKVTSTAHIREDIIQATTELQDRVRGPDGIIRHSFGGLAHSSAMQALIRFDFASKIPIQQSIRYDELAEKCNLTVSVTRRLVRYMCTCRILREVDPRHVAHTAASRALAENSDMKAWAGMMTEEWLPATNHLVDALQTWPRSSVATETGWSLGHNTTLLPFEEIRLEPLRAQRFAMAMNYVSQMPPMHLRYLLHAFPWANPPSDQTSLLVDVGGSYGSVSKALLAVHPKLRCVVQDLPEVIASIDPTEDFDGRLSFAGQDFFCPQQTQNADIYFLRMVLHDWPDQYAAGILRNLIPALKTGAKVVLCEMCMPEPGQIPADLERRLRALDLGMQANFNSLERSKEDWEELFRTADLRFRDVRVHSMQGSMLSLIESTWRAL